MFLISICGSQKSKTIKNILFSFIYFRNKKISCIQKNSESWKESLPNIHKCPLLCRVCILYICSWQRRADIPWVYCNILSNSTGYFVIRWVTSRMNSGTPLRLTRELLLCCCDETCHFLYLTAKIQRNMIFSWAAYFDKVLKFFILLQQFFENTHSLRVMAAELSIYLLHFLCIFIWKLRQGP